MQCPYLFIHRGYTNGSDFRLVRVGSSVSVGCDDGYILEGDRLVACLPGGTWSSEPRCTRENIGSGGFDTTLVIVVCSVASAVVVGVMLFALYVLCGKVRTEKEMKQIEKEEKEKEDLQNLRMYLSVDRQDNVGMPAVVYGNYNATLRGKPTCSIESLSSNVASGLDPPVTASEMDFQTSKAFIY